MLARPTSRHRGSTTHPFDAGVGRRAESVGQLRAMMLDVADTDELMLELGHLVPRESTLRTLEIEQVDCAVHRVIHEAPVFEDLRLRVRFAPGAVVITVMLTPEDERRLVLLQVQVCEEQHVVGELPERILVIPAQPLRIGTLLDGISQHRECSVVLALQHRSNILDQAQCDCPAESGDDNTLGAKRTIIVSTAKSRRSCASRKKGPVTGPRMGPAKFCHGVFDTTGSMIADGC